MKILMVCLGNICRSPLAQGIMEKKIAQRQLDWTVDSAGTSQWHIGEKPDPRSIAVAQQHGINIQDQHSRGLSQDDFSAFDYIFVMDKSNYEDAKAMCRNQELHARIVPILSYLHDSEMADVPDPYWNDNGFLHVYRLLDAACDYWVDYLSTQAH